MFSDYALMFLAKDREREVERIVDRRRRLKAIREQRAQEYAMHIHEAREDLRREQAREFRRRFV